MYIYIYMHRDPPYGPRYVIICIYTHPFIYTYMYRERERGVDVLLAESNAGSVVWPMVRYHMYICMHAYICIYVYVYIYGRLAGRIKG